MKPNYYKNQSGDLLSLFFTLNDLGARWFCRFNIIKYVLRYDQKNGVEDLQKAKEYLDRLIEKESE